MSEIAALALNTDKLSNCLQEVSTIKNNQLPEKQWIDSIAHQQQRFTELLQRKQPEINRLVNPQAMLAIQHGMMQATVTIELAAKLAGSLTQAVNRLATIQ